MIIGGAREKHPEQERALLYCYNAAETRDAKTSLCFRELQFHAVLFLQPTPLLSSNELTLILNTNKTRTFKSLAVFDPRLDDHRRYLQKHKQI